jgi:arsenate reductase
MLRTGVGATHVSPLLEKNMVKQRVLFLCTGNSARSQMAEALLNMLGGDRFEAYSAGLEPKGVHPMTLEVLREAGIDPAKLVSKHMKEFFGKQTFQYLITVCDQADKNCPTTWPGVQHRLHWSFSDPAAVVGTREEELSAFRKIRDEIEKRIKAWLQGLT